MCWGTRAQLEVCFYVLIILNHVINALDLESKVDLRALRGESSNESGLKDLPGGLLC